MRLLIVDDNDDFREMLKLRLSSFAHCDTAADGDEAIRMFGFALRSNAPYDLIFLDLNMPVLDGFQTIAAIRDAERNSPNRSRGAVRIILITGLADQLEAARRINSGYEALVSKSQGVNRLLATMRELGCSIPEHEAPR